MVHSAMIEQRGSDVRMLVRVVAFTIEPLPRTDVDVPAVAPVLLVSCLVSLIAEDPRLSRN